MHINSEMPPTVMPAMKILVVEDNPISRKLTRLALEAEGFSVIEAVDGRSAIDYVTQEMPDLILQDILLPDMDGFEIVNRLHSLPGAEKIPILALTGLISVGDEKKLPTAPFADYLFKPVEPSFLISTVRAHLAASQTSEHMPGEGRVILVVDDDPTQLKLLATYLANLGFGVTTATDGGIGLAAEATTPLRFALSDVDAECVAGQTVLQTARASGVRIPAACEFGLCGTCKVKKVSGKVEMSHNGGILDHEIEDGFILACCSKPLSALEIEA